MAYLSHFLGIKRAVGIKESLTVYSKNASILRHQTYSLVF